MGVGDWKLMVCSSKLSQYCVGWDVEGVRGSKRAESGVSTRTGEGERRQMKIDMKATGAQLTLDGVLEK